MTRSGRGASLLAVAIGAPLYAALDWMAALPPHLRDRPWPFEIAACSLLAWAVADLRRATGEARGRSTIIVACAVVATLGFSRAARVELHRLGPPEPALVRLPELPDVELLDPAGALVRPSSLRGAPLVVAVIRGLG